MSTTVQYYGCPLPSTVCSSRAWFTQAKHMSIQISVGQHPTKFSFQAESQTTIIAYKTQLLLACSVVWFHHIQQHRIVSTIHKPCFSQPSLQLSSACSNTPILPPSHQGRLILTVACLYTTSGQIQCLLSIGAQYLFPPFLQLWTLYLCWSTALCTLHRGNMLPLTSSVKYVWIIRIIDQSQ